MAEQLEIQVAFVREKTRRDDWCAGEADYTAPGETYPRRIGFSGKADVDELQPGREYRFYGAWEDRGRWGKSFKVQTFIEAEPLSKAGVVKYLQECEQIGDRRAEILWDKFRSNAVKILREKPETAHAAINSPHFTLAMAQKASEFLKEQVSLEACSIELMDFISGHGISKSAIRWAIRKFGNNAAWVLRHNPFHLMKVRGVGFMKCKSIYTSLGLPPNKIKIQAIAGHHKVAEISKKEGHTWTPVSVFETGIRECVSGAAINNFGALKLAKRAGQSGLDAIEIRWAGDDLFVAESKKAEAEAYVARMVAEAMLERATWPEVDESFCSLPGGKKLSDHQREQVSLALKGPIACFGGAPGSGKTTTASAIVRAIIAEYGVGSIVLAAPTGKAAVRLSESMAGNGIPLRARTIHSVLKVMSADDGDGWSFGHGAGNPLPFRFIVVDECSMVDTSLMAHLLAARAKGTNVLLIGDINQLPPVGHGAPLRDLIRAGVSYGELREIQRNSGTIVKACAAIRDDKPWEPDGELDPENGVNLKLVHASNGAVATEEIVALLKRIRDAEIADPIWDCQVIVAVNKKSPLSRITLNERLQAELNPSGEGCEGSPFRVGDKVVQLKNGFLQECRDPRASKVFGAAKFNVIDASRGESPWSYGDPPEGEPPAEEEIVKNDKGQVYVANGEFGRVLAVEATKTIVEFPNPTRIVSIPRSQPKKKAKPKPDEEGDDDSAGQSASGCDMDLGYAATCHRLQGSEVRIAVIVLDEYAGATGPHGICTREWIFTGLSRAKEACFMVGKMQTARTMCQKVALPKRKTFLVERIAEEVERLKAEPVLIESVESTAVVPARPAQPPDIIPASRVEVIEQPEMEYLMSSAAHGGAQ